MAESESFITREEDLTTNNHRVILRRTAEIFDYLSDAPWLMDRDAAADFLRTKTLRFIRSTKEGVYRLPFKLNADSLADALKEARKIPYYVSDIYHPGPTEAFGFSLVILSHMQLPERQRVDSPAQFLNFTEAIEQQIREISANVHIPQIKLEDPDYQRTQTFFNIGRRLPIKYLENPHEAKEREDYQFYKLLGLTN